MSRGGQISSQLGSGRCGRWGGRGLGGQARQSRLRRAVERARCHQEYRHQGGHGARPGMGQSEHAAGAVAERLASLGARGSARVSLLNARHRKASKTSPRRPVRRRHLRIAPPPDSKRAAEQPPRNVPPTATENRAGAPAMLAPVFKPPVAMQPTHLPPAPPTQRTSTVRRLPRRWLLLPLLPQQLPSTAPRHRSHDHASCGDRPAHQRPPPNQGNRRRSSPTLRRLQFRRRRRSR